ncbi:MAG: hypothetical protein K2P26_10885, partial [Oscillospiraceae bacterium]|nr:hypothetical protein [Oscillospiraceae bacterium]
VRRRGRYHQEGQEGLSQSCGTVIILFFEKKRMKRNFLRETVVSLIWDQKRGPVLCRSPFSMG